MGTFASIDRINDYKESNDSNNATNEIGSNNSNNGKITKENVNKLNFEEIIKEEKLILEKKLINTKDFCDFFRINEMLYRVTNKSVELRHNNKFTEKNFLNCIHLEICESIVGCIIEDFKESSDRLTDDNDEEEEISDKRSTDGLSAYIYFHLIDFCSCKHEKENELYECVDEYLRKYNFTNKEKNRIFEGINACDYEPRKYYTDEEKNELCNFLYKEAMKFQDTEYLSDFKDYVKEWVRCVFLLEKVKECQEEIDRCDSHPATYCRPTYQDYIDNLKDMSNLALLAYECIIERLNYYPQEYFYKMGESELTKNLVDFSIN